MNAGEDNSTKNDTASSKLTLSLRDSKTTGIWSTSRIENELKARKLKLSGSKKELQYRLVDDLKREAGAAVSMVSVD